MTRLGNGFTANGDSGPTERHNGSNGKMVAFPVNGANGNGKSANGHAGNGKVAHESHNGHSRDAESGVRVGVVGCGYWGSKHLRVLQTLESVASVKVIDSELSRLDSLARSLPDGACFASVEEALPHVDALVIATPPATHAPLALRAIRAGKHVLVEKPLATSVVSALQMIQAAEDAGTVLMVGHTFEFNSAVWKMRELVESGALGQLYYIDSARLNLGLYQGDVNVVFDLAPHDISIINYLLGAEPTAVDAWASRHAHSELEDVAYLRLQYGTMGVEANVHVSWLDPHKVRRVTAVGSQKMAVYNDMAVEERIRLYDKGVVVTPPNELTQPPMTYRYGDIVSPHLEFREPLLLEDSHFLECIRTGATPLTDGQNGLAVVRVLEAAERSLYERRPVDMSDVADASALSLTMPAGAQ